MKNHVVIPLILLLVAMGSFSYAASVSLVPGGNGVYYLKANDFDEVGGVEVEVSYDTNTLSNPRISQGPLLNSAMFIPNSKFSASSLKIAAMTLSTIKGSGDLATITFDVKGSVPGSVTIVRSKLAAATGKKIVQDNPPSGSVSQEKSDSATAGTAGTTTQTTTTSVSTDIGSGSGVALSGIAVGTITLPSDGQASADTKKDYQPLVTDLRKDMTVPSAGAEKSQSASKPDGKEKDVQKKYESFDGVLQLFKSYKGEKSIKSLVSLFADAEIKGFSQSPAIAIADGKTPVTITLQLKPASDESPKFMMQGAKIKNLKSAGEDVVTWTIDALPKKDVFDMKMTVLDGTRIAEYPITVVPKINPMLAKGKQLSEADFTLYLAKPPKFDFNIDKKFDAVDDYIYTANYIVDMKIKPEKTVKVQKGKKEEAPSKPLKEKESVDRKDAEPSKKPEGVVKPDKGKPGSTTKPVTKSKTSGKSDKKVSSEKKKKNDSDEEGSKSSGKN